MPRRRVVARRQVARDGRPAAANDTRYRLLETVRAPLRFLLDEAGETVATALRLTDWWLERVGPWHHTDRETSGEIEVELDNLRAMVPLIARHDENRAQQLVCSIGRHYYAALASSDRIAELSRYVAELPTPSPARVSMLGTLALMQVHRGDVDAARATLALGEHEQEDVGAPSWDEVAVERAAGEIALRTGDYASAASLAERNLEARARRCRPAAACSTSSPSPRTSPATSNGRRRPSPRSSRWRVRSATSTSS